jgi:trans-AT polyketide synthase/acyltransferase/oxidoreductase domain-containing protein
MANGIASEELVIAAGKAGLLGSFGAAGLVPSRIEAAIQQIQQVLPQGPYAFNLIHSPNEDALERNGCELFLKHGVSTVEASAYLDLTPHIVRYRVSGLEVNAEGQLIARNRVIAKVSRPEVARKFMEPPPERLLRELLAQNWITEQQAHWAAQMPMADDLTVEADSGGHTDNRPLVALLPGILALRDEIQAERGYAVPLRVGVGGGLGTPAAVLAAFAMGAAYVVTGSVNQGCREAGASEHTKHLLAQAEMADVAMAPAADMFEMGVELQVLKRGTLFPMRARKLYELYRTYESLEDIPDAERTRLEQQTFRQPLDAVWESTRSFFNERDPEVIARAQDHPKRKMALVFRWYLGLSSRWSNHGETGRETDYQIWCGPAMGAFNDWVRGSYLEAPDQRTVVAVATHLMQGAAYLSRVQQLRWLGALIPPELNAYRPEPQA